MSPRPAREDLKLRLVEAAARLLAEDGPAALSARRLADECDASTSAVYTYFGSMPGLVRAVVREGFDRLERELAAVRRTPDPVLDNTRLLYAYQASGRANPHIYRVMFGGSSVAGFQLSAEDRRIGVGTFRIGVEGIRRAIDAQAYARADPWELALRFWSSIHGFVMLDINGYFFEARTADRCLHGLVSEVQLGAGCDPARVTEASRRARRSAARAGQLHPRASD